MVDDRVLNGRLESHAVTDVLKTMTNQDSGMSSLTLMCDACGYSKMARACPCRWTLLHHVYQNTTQTAAENEDELDPLHHTQPVAS